MRVLFLPKSPDATRVYRVDIPAKYLMRAGHEVRIRYPEPVKPFESETLNVEDVAWADVVIWQRPATSRAFEMLEHMKAVYPNIPMLGDYDDDYESVPRWNPGYQFIKINERHWPRFFTEFDGIMASTDPLAEKLSLCAPRADVVTIKNGFDFEEFDAIEPNATAGLFIPKTDGDRVVAEASVDIATFNEMMRDKLVVAWAGSRFHYVDLDLLPEDLLDVTKKRQDVVFLFVGYAQGKIINALPKNSLYLTGGRAPITEFYRLLKTLKIDAMLAPVDACEFNKSKSGLKVIEAMACNAYPICSDWHPYFDEICEDGCHDRGHGSLVWYDPGGWSKKILAWADLKSQRPEAHKLMMEDNAAYVRRAHDATTRTKEYLSFFEKMIARKS